MCRKLAASRKDSREAGAPAETEIEITPEMMEAGRAAYWRNIGDQMVDVTVYAIFRDMIVASGLFRSCREA
jgi:hypothetical protein